MAYSQPAWLYSSKETFKMFPNTLPSMLSCTLPNVLDYSLPVFFTYIPKNALKMLPRIVWILSMCKPRNTSEHILIYSPRYALHDASNCTWWYTLSLLCWILLAKVWSHTHTHFRGWSQVCSELYLTTPEYFAPHSEVYSHQAWHFQIWLDNMLSLILLCIQIQKHGKLQALRTWT